MTATAVETRPLPGTHHPDLAHLAGVAISSPVVHTYPHGSLVPGGDAPPVITLQQRRCAAPAPYVGPRQNYEWDVWTDGERWVADSRVWRVTHPVDAFLSDLFPASDERSRR